MKQAFEKIVKLLTWYSKKSIINRELGRLQGKILEYRNTAELRNLCEWTCIQVSILALHLFGYSKSNLFPDLHWEVVKKHCKKQGVSYGTKTIHPCHPEVLARIRFNALTETAALMSEIQEDIRSGIDLEMSIRSLTISYELQNNNISEA